MENFKADLEEKYLKVNMVEVDGNSLFRAVSDQFLGVQKHHPYYRNKAIDYMREN